MGNDANRTQQTPKRIRTCIACGEKSTKMSLHRIVRTPAGQITYDPKGRAAGRGAYVCSVACLERAFKTKRIDRALKTTVGQEDKERIVQVMRDTLCDSSE